MTNLRTTERSPMTREMHVTIAVILMILSIILISFIGYRYASINMELGKTLLTAPLSIKGHLTTWGQQLNAHTPIMAAIKCNNSSLCQGWFNRSLESKFNVDTALYLVMFFFTATTIAWRMIPTKFIQKDPGQGRWASIKDPSIIAVVDIKKTPYRDKFVLEDEKRLDKWSKRSLYLGHMFSWDEVNGFNWKKPEVLMLRERVRHENILVTGAPGSGKTRGMYRPNICLDAVNGNTAIVFDLKWPQTDSGFKDMILFWKRRGRPVYIFAPFSPNSMRIPLLEGIETMDQALSLAEIIIPKPEYAEEAGKYYKEIERRMMGAIILAVAQSATPTMKEMQRLGAMNVAEFEQWYQRQQNPEIKSALKSIWDQRPDQISATLAGLMNSLRIFQNENVSRATSAGSDPRETIPTKEALRSGALIIIGIETKYAQNGLADILFQMAKRKLDADILDIASEETSGMVPVTATYYLDELPGLGKLPYLMANLGQLRSKGVCIMLGVQNTKQGEVVYGPLYWEATTSGNVGTRIDFISGTTGQEAVLLSERIGQTTVYATSSSLSNHALFGSPLSAEARKSQSLKTEKVALLSPEEIKRFPRNYAAVTPKEVNTALVATPAIDSEYLILRTPEGKGFKIKNQLYHYWQETMGDIKGIKDLEEKLNAAVDELTVKVKDGQPIETAKSAPEYWQDWLRILLEKGALCRKTYVNNEMRVFIKQESLSEDLSREKDLRYFVESGWMEKSTTGEMIIVPEGFEIAGKILRESIEDFVSRAPALYWLRKSREEDRKVEYNPETLLIPVGETKELYGVLPNLPIETRDGKEYLVIPLSDPATIEEAIENSLPEENKKNFRKPGKPKENHDSDQKTNNKKEKNQNTAEQLSMNLEKESQKANEDLDEFQSIHSFGPKNIPQAAKESEPKTDKQSKEEDEKVNKKEEPSGTNSDDLINDLMAIKGKQEDKKDQSEDIKKIPEEEKKQVKDEEKNPSTPEEEKGDDLSDLLGNLSISGEDSKSESKLRRGRSEKKKKDIFGDEVTETETENQPSVKSIGLTEDPEIF